MLRSILVKQNLKNLTTLNQFHLPRKCSTKTLNDLVINNIKNIKNDPQQINKPTADELIDPNQHQFVASLAKEEDKSQEEAGLEDALKDEKETDEILNLIDECNDISVLLESIGSKVDEFQVVHLTKAYQKIILLWFAKNRSAKDNLELNKLVLMSPTFKQLLNRTEQLISDLDAKCLIKVFQTFSLVNQNPMTKVVDVVLAHLVNKIDELSLGEINDCLMAFNFYYSSDSSDRMKSTSLHKNTFKLGSFTSLREIFLEKVSTKVMNNEFNYKDINLILDLIGSFSNDLNGRRSFKVITYLAESFNNLIELGQFEFNLKQSVTLLSLLKKIDFIRIRDDQSTLPKLYYDLIDKCNMVTYLQLKLRPDDDLFKFYLYKLHNREDDHHLHLESLYSPKTLSIVSSYLRDNLDKHSKFQVYNLVANHFRFGIFDEELFKQVYKLICDDKEFRNRLDFFNVYFLFSRFKLPFIDYDHLADILFDLDNRKLQLKLKNVQNIVKVFNELILSDVKNKNLYKGLIKLAGQHLDGFFNFEKEFKSISKLQFQDMLLAKVYLTEFSELEPELKSEIERRLSQIVKNCLSVLPNLPLMNNYYHADDRVQRGVYLSNGLFLRNVVVVYDKSLNNLIPLTEFRSYFYKMDKMPLKKDQELVVFIESRSLTGEFTDNYETAYNSALKKVLNNLAFKTIDVNQIEFIKLKYLKERVNFFVKKALDNCK